MYQVGINKGITKNTSSTVYRYIYSVLSNGISYSLRYAENVKYCGTFSDEFCTENQNTHFMFDKRFSKILQFMR